MEMVTRGTSLQTLKAAVQELFDHYLGGSRSSKNEDSGKDIVVLPAQKRIMAANKSRPPNNDQFAIDFKQLQSQFPDQEQLRIVVESTLATLFVSCSGHMVQVEFLLSAVHALSRDKLLNWNSFLLLLLRAASAFESSGQARSSAQPGPGSSQGGPSSLTAVSAVAVQASHTPSVGMPQVSTPAPPASPASAVIGSPPYSVADQSVNQSPAKVSDPSSNGLPSKAIPVQQSYKVATWLRQVVCKVILLGSGAADLHPVTCLEVLSQMVQWVHTWDAVDANEEDNLQKSFQKQLHETEWLYNCLDVIKVFVNDANGRLPFYALLHDRTQLQIENWPDDEVLFGFFLEVHRRRDRIAFFMQMLDQHLQCPTFASQRMIAFAYQGAIGEPLYGEDIAAAVPRGTIEWERALRCLKHGLRAIPSTEWWRRVLITAPRFSQQQPSAPRQGYFVSSMPSFVFTAVMTCEAVVDRILELMQPANTGNTSTQSSDGVGDRWQEWLSFVDLFFFLVRHGYLDILEFINMLATYSSNSDHQTIRSNHVTWLLAQVFRLDTVTTAMSTDDKKIETTQKILSFHKEGHPADQNGNISPQEVVLDFVSGSQIMRLWTINHTMMEHLAGKHVPEHLQKGKQIDEWWKQAGQGERVMDFSNLDDKSMGMFWVMSLTMSQPVCEAMMSWMKTNGIAEIPLSGGIGQAGDRLLVVQETQPLSMTLLSGLSLHVCTRFIGQIEDQIFVSQVLPSIAMMETYARLLLIAPLTLFRSHVTGMMSKYQQTGKSGISITILELLNYRLLPLYRYHGKVKQLLYDVAKIIIAMKTKRGEHRLFRLAENLCLNLILSLPEVILVKRELKGATTEFSETLNRAMIVNLAFTIKTRGIAEFEQQVILAPAIDQILANSPHSWSEKTLRYFPPVLRDILAARPDKRSQTLQGWQQAESTMIHQCRQLLSPTADPSHLINFFNHVFPQHRQYLCAAAWVLLEKQPDSVNTGHLGRVLKELSAEEVTANIYVMVDVLLVNAQMLLQRHAAQDVLYRINTTLAGLVWNQELLPFDILLLALADRDDDPVALRIVVWLLFETPEFQQRVQNHCRSRGSSEHWLNHGPFQRTDPQAALGSHLMGKDRFPVYFDDMCVRALPVFTLLLYRFIENDVLDVAEQLLEKYFVLFTYHPTRFTFVRDTLAYFYGHLPSKFVIKLLSNLDLTKIPFSDAFLQEKPSSSSGNFTDYLSNLLINLVNLVIPPLTSKLSMESSLGGGTKPQTLVSPLVSSSLPEIPKAFYQHQDPGTYPQLVLETAVIELLSLPHSCNEIVSTLVHISVRVQPCGQSQPQHGSSQPHLPTTSTNNSGHPQTINSSNLKSPLLPSSPPAAGVDSYVSSTASSAGATNTAATQNLAPASPLMIQACGLLLAQLPTPFHSALYSEAARMFKNCWWMTNSNKLNWEMDAAYGYSVWDPTWAVEDDTSTIIGNLLALLHVFSSHLSFDGLEGMHAVISLQRPIMSTAQLRLAFRIIGPLLPRLVISKPLFTKTLALLFSILAEVFGQKSQPASSINIDEISDLIDFLHHAVMLDGQAGGKPRLETLMLCSKAVERLHADLQPFFRHLGMDTNVSIYAATHPKLAQMPPSPLLGIV
eukprot:c21786_g1_i1 orf=152-5008(+)